MFPNCRPESWPARVQGSGGHVVTQCGDHYGVTGQWEHCHWGPQWWGVPGHLHLFLVSLALFLAIMCFHPCWVPWCRRACEGEVCES